MFLTTTACIVVVLLVIHPLTALLMRATKKGNTMSTLYIPRSVFDLSDDADYMICVFCDTETDLPYCVGCQEYKGLMSVSDWESYTGEKWEV